MIKGFIFQFLTYLSISVLLVHVCLYVVYWKTIEGYCGVVFK